MEQILKQILSELREFKQETKERLDKLEGGQESLKTELKKDIKDLSTMLVTSASRFDTIDSNIAGVSKKLDRQTASSRSNSVKVRELEMRIEDLEVSPPVK